MSAISRALLPDNASVEDGRLAIAGCDVIELADEFGTPVFIYDEDHIRERCRQAVAGFPDGVAYATKAFLCGAMAHLATDEGMDLDVATGGELALALAAGVAPQRIVMHGNNKAVAELSAALEAGVKHIVVDNFDELDALERLAATGETAANVLVRLNPAVKAHTHEFLQTGIADSKFGFPIARGAAARAIERCRSSGVLNFRGVHSHIGSQVYAPESFAKALRVTAAVAAEFDAPELCVGGGLGVAYRNQESAPSISEWAEVVRSEARRLGVTARITAEPGRCIVASAAVTAYRVGVIKDIAGVRRYVAVDGGMSDNPRPVLYGSGYEALLARAADASADEEVRVVGKHCEAGDIVVADAKLPAGAAVGDILVTPVTGAYGHAMASNYNMVARPPVVFVRNGSARLVVRRETHADMFARDVALS